MDKISMNKLDQAGQRFRQQKPSEDPIIAEGKRQERQFPS
jgi:hypothetical protein